MKAFLDTHAAVFLYEGDPGRFGPAGLELLERAVLFCSPMVRLELALLHESGRIEPPPEALLGTLADELGVAESRDPLEAIVREAVAFAWTRDPFDRMIVATAALHRAPLLTRDGRIRRHFAGAVW
ncbi:MAG: PIN domain-containing protein [Thermoanaerobaculia bacterium]|nr:PIN domain-containing protein [Thermoanaerobaculia bacterium]